MTNLGLMQSWFNFSKILTAIHYTTILKEKNHISFQQIEIKPLKLYLLSKKEIFW